MELVDGTRPLAQAFKGFYAEPQNIDYAVIDAFSDGVFGGNPAAVIVLPKFKDNKWMQDVAAEFNLSETCYLVKKETKIVEGELVAPQDEASVENAEVRSAVDSESELTEVSDHKTQRNDSLTSKSERQLVIHEYDLRWFTPVAEVDLCGHGTLASAYLLFQTGLVGTRDTIFFHTRSGLLSVRNVGPKDGGAQSFSADGRQSPMVDMVELNFPWITTTPCTFSAVAELSQSLKNVEAVAVGKASHFLIVELATRADLEKLQPDMQELLRADSAGLYATAPCDPGSEFDFISRCFFPKLGVDEDPVCGSAHCALGPYWSTKLGKDNLLAYQGSKRGGTLALQVDKKIGRVYIRGQAAMVMAGVLIK